MKKILLADDSITIQKVVELTFSEGDYQVVCVSNGAQALKKVEEVRPDIVLLDVIMPEKNGYEVCELIKRNPATSSIPVLLLTGTFEPFDKKKAEAVGAQGHLTKPFESQVLVAKVEEMINAMPRVSSAEAGGMEIISGGDVYHVDPARPQQTMQPSAAPISAGLSAGAASPGPVGPMSPAEAMPPPPAPRLSSEPSDEDWPHAATAPPNPADGGSYIGFADLGAGASDAEEIVPDRFDADDAAPTSTVRVARENLFRGDTFGGPAAGSSDEDAGAFTLSDEPMEGLTGAFEEQPAGSARPPLAGAPAPEADSVWTPPPEAPPAETWQEPDGETRPNPLNAPVPFAPLPAPSTVPHQNGGPALNLTPEAIDLIAEKVVERLSDRIVREVAWEVIPQVAEALVRRRIKELEEEESR